MTEFAVNTRDLHFAGSVLAKSLNIRAVQTPGVESRTSVVQILFPSRLIIKNLLLIHLDDKNTSKFSIQTPVTIRTFFLFIVVLLPLLITRHQHVTESDYVQVLQIQN